MKKILYIILFLFAFLYLTISYLSGVEKDKLLDNNIKFSGIIKGMKISKNHSFSIFYVELDSSNIEIVYDSVNIFPYRVKNTYGEIYAICDTKHDSGRRFTFNSAQRLFIIEDFDNTKDTMVFSMVSDPTDVDFVKKYTKFEK